MKIFDKASWHIDSGIDKKVVVEYFDLVFKWLDEHNMLSELGKELLELGIDLSVSLNEETVNRFGAEFLNLYYDLIISESKFDIEKERNLFSDYLKEYLKDN